MAPNLELLAATEQESSAISNEALLVMEYYHIDPVSPLGGRFVEHPAMAFTLGCNDLLDITP